LCSLLDIGSPAGDLARVYGGLHHKVWRLDTDRGSYAVKQLAADTDFGDADMVNHYNVTEAIAEAFAGRGIAAVFALRSKAGYLQLIENAGYLVYPWTNAVGLQLDQTSEEHALQVARVLARMHGADIVVPGLKEPAFDVHPEDRILELVHIASEFGVRIAEPLKRHTPLFLDIAAAQVSAVRVLEKHVVISHGDMDQKNVLWDAAGQPVIIDWESARKLNPTFECVLEALDWSGITSRFDSSLFRKFISAYRKEGGMIEGEAIHESFDCILGDWLNWLMYNVGRACDLEDVEQRLLGAEQVDFALSTILHLQQEIPGLLSLASGGEAHV
jgi:Ser/Thr protein kinase RdoA (MazF antagonist)